jgi:hypothetical protein
MEMFVAVIFSCNSSITNFKKFTALEKYHAIEIVPNMHPTNPRILEIQFDQLTSNVTNK